MLAAAYVQGSVPAAVRAQGAPPAVQRFVEQNCAGCHTGPGAGGGLRFESAAFEPQDAASSALWVKVYDRVQAGEMPPKTAPQPTAQAKQSFLAALAQPLYAVRDARVKAEGRAVLRRMNRYEYENTLRDLLGAPWLQIREMLPEDGLAFRFNKVGEALDVSHVNISRYMAAADYALREVMAHEVARPKTPVLRYYAREQRSFASLAKFNEFNGSPERATFPIIGSAADVPALEGRAPMTVGAADPARRELEGMGVVASAYEPLQPKFNQFRAPASGRYKLRLRAHSFWAGPESARRWWHPSRHVCSAGRTREPVSLYGSLPPEQLRKLGSFDVGPEPATNELDVYLLRGETILPDAARLFRSRPPNWHNPLAEPDGQPGVVFQWLEVEGPIYETWPALGHKLLFGDLPLRETGIGKVEALSSAPDADSERLLRQFIARALRRPSEEADVQPFVRLAARARSAGASFTESMLAAYTAALCSPAFLEMQERPGPLDDHALASRLSYFLWNSEPDSTLRAEADRKRLHDPAVLKAQADRMLADPRAARFAGAFLDYWLDLRKADSSSPDELLYPDYYLDDFLRESAVDETRAFFLELVRGNLPARNVVASDFIMVNGRLAQLYGIPGVEGSAIRRVPLPNDSVRGGLLTQASILKVTANGTTTSPVLRGVWINERILGHTVPPPPASVPAVDPDTRGATTIREQLAKHRTQPACSACHAKIDPAGFALESFDVCGGWRGKYRALTGGEKAPGYGKNGQPFAFRGVQPVDPSGELPDGRKFSDVRDLKRLLLQDERQIARNLANQLVTYSTGAPVQFGDRPKVEAILTRAKPGGYGVKSLILAIIASDLFRSK